MELSLKKLDQIILKRMIQTVQETKQRTINLNVEDLLTQGYTQDDIEESMARLQTIDGRILSPETLEAMYEASEGKGEKFENVDELFKSISMN